MRNSLCLKLTNDFLLLTRHFTNVDVLIIQHCTFFLVFIISRSYFRTIIPVYFIYYIDVVEVLGLSLTSTLWLNWLLKQANTGEEILVRIFKLQ